MKRKNPLNYISKMKLPTSIIAGLAAAGIMLCGSAVQAQPAIANVFPNGAYQLQSTNALTFNATSSVGITNISVALNATKLTGGSILRNLTSASGLTVTGPATSESVSGPLTSNRLYSVTIQVTDANGATASTNLSFDTISPAYVFESEDFDYNSGQYIDNPQTNAYRTLAAVGNVDAYNLNGGSSYRPVGNATNGGAGLSTEGTGDKPRVPYIGTGHTDYDVGYTDNGDWANYTRHYPAGLYNIYMRAANPNGRASDAASISVWAGTASLNNAGTFAVPTTGGWQVYQWVPMLDASNNPVQLTILNDGLPNTLRASTDPSGSYNVNYYMFVQVDTNPPVAGEAIITNMYPDGTYQFQQTNQFVFNVISTNGINPSDITVQLNGTNLAGVGSAHLLTGGSGLTVTGPSTSLSCSAPLTSNTVYTVTIQIIDSFGNVSGTNIIFDTINPAYYTFEAEDWDYNSGLFINNPQIDAYQNLDGVNGVDVSGPAGGSILYNRLGLSAETAHDIPRLGYYSLVNGSLVANTNPATALPYIDYDVNPSGGVWGNYTRNYPAGTYNIFVRAASGGGTTADCGSFSVVTSGQTTSSQTTSKFGTYSMVNSGGWQTYIWRPVMNAGGSLARFTADGSAITLRYTYDGANANQNFYMLVPADTSVNFRPFVSNFQPDGSQPFQYTNKLTFTVNSSVGMSANNILLNIDGGNVSGLTISGSPTLWNVSFPVTVNGFHTAIITVTDSVGTSISTNKFDTFDPNTYTFESEDYDYSSDGINGGLFIDNPQTDLYSGLGSVLNVDDHWDYNNGAGYRPSSGAGDGLATESPCSDWVRPQYSSASLKTYNIGHNDGGNWANYTRNYPAGAYNIWMRMASPNGNPSTTDAAKVSVVTSGWGTTNQTTTVLGRFTTPNTGGWGVYTGGWAPLMDANGNYVQWTASGSTNTLKVTIDNGNFNQDFYALVPADTTRPTLAGLYPNGSTQLQSTNTLSFNAISSGGISTNNIVVILNGVVVSNLVFTGSSTNWHVSDPNLQTNTFYSVSIAFTGLAGGAYNTSFSFDTYSSTDYQWEAEDYDYNGGQFYDNLINAYNGLGSIPDVDNHQSDLNANPFLYRLNSPAPSTATGDLSGEQPRAKFTSGGGSGTDYYIGFFGGGSWVNYTRHYPAGTYNVIGRFADGAALSQPTLSQVTSGVGTTNQTVNVLGSFTVVSLGWTTWEWVSLKDASGNLVKVTLDGSANTLRYSGSPVAGQPEVNTGFFMLVPTTPSLKLTISVSGGNITISFQTQTGSNYQLQYKNNLTDATWTTLGSPISGNNAVQSVNGTATGSSRFYRVQAQ